MATFSRNSAKSGWTAYKFIIKNTSNRHVEYNFNNLVRDVGTELKTGDFQGVVGKGTEKIVNFDSNTRHFEQGNVSILKVDDQEIYFRFWSSSSGSDQYININPVSPLKVTDDRSSICTGVVNNTEITLDGGGGTQETLNIHLQIHNT
jgi:hypothetical protein